MLNKNGALPLTSLNHISIVCASVQRSVDFYQNVLGFFPVRRPGSFDFDGAWYIYISLILDILNLPSFFAMFDINICLAGCSIMELAFIYFKQRIHNTNLRKQ